MKDIQWASLVESVRTGSCVLALGPDIPALPEGVGAIGSDENISVRDAFCQYLTKQLEEENLKVEEKALFALAQLYEDWRDSGQSEKCRCKFFSECSI